MSELRQDLVSGDWIIMAPVRADRPHNIGGNKQKRKPAPKKKCPFEDLKKSGNWPPILAYPNAKNWKIVAIPNKYPVLSHAKGCAIELYRGPYRLKTGVGEHNLLITRDHNKTFADLSLADAAKVLGVLQERYKTFASDKCNVYVSTFFNWGATAGASIYHPHYQILVLPIIPPHIKASLFGAERYYKEHKRCVRCESIKFDLKDKKSIVEQNAYALASIPFASKQPFEVRILPKKHLPYFSKTSPAELKGVAMLLQSVLKRIKKYLHDPDLNFFIHGAPLDYGRYSYHHWHIEIIPKISVWGGFELSTGVDINVIDPERAAAILRGK